LRSDSKLSIGPRFIVSESNCALLSAPLLCSSPVSGLVLAKLMSGLVRLRGGD
jgi:hypothetical protein